MRRSKILCETTAVLVILAVLTLFLPTSPAMAGWIPTRPVVESPQARFMAVLDRAEVATALAELGIDPQEARRRAATLTDDEARLALQKIDTLPAGGSVASGLITAALLIFLVLLVTDLLGLTDVYPFVKKTAT